MFDWQHFSAKIEQSFSGLFSKQQITRALRGRISVYFHTGCHSSDGVLLRERREIVVIRERFLVI